MKTCCGPVRPAALALAAACLTGIGAPAAFAADALGFFNNWFVTGDYAVAGVGLKNTAGQGTINLAGVPCTSGVGASAAIVPCTTAGATPAYPVAAFLYWQNVENSAAPAIKGAFNGFPLTGADLLASDGGSACWVSAPAQTLRSYRADVLRFLPFDPATKVRLANGAHTVSLGAAAGNGGVISTLGASLVVIYKVAVPGRPTLATFRSVVIYDGEFTLTKEGPDMTQTVAGFYQAATVAAARMTHIVGNGQNGFRETLMVGAGSGDHPAAYDANAPFVGAQGANWDNLTFPFDLAAGAASTAVRSHVSGGQSNCLSWSAVVTSTNVQDSDLDGLLDVWETRGLHRNTQASPATFGGCADYPSEPCVNLPAMGAKNGVRDMFLETHWLHGNGVSADRPAHSHKPKLDALQMVADAFAAQGIAVHFDVGPNYQGLPFIVPAAVAQGGHDLNEDSLACHPQAGKPPCAYPNYPALSFKLGFNSVRDGNRQLGIPANFAQNRKDVFRFVLFAHALAGPFDAQAKPLPDPFNPGSTLPRSYSGIADRPGADIMITLGLWRSDIPANDQVGSSLTQAGTLMHEMGHSLNLSHGGLATAPNCAPNYPSVMSYLYQTRGLIDSRGVPRIDFSAGLLSPMNENLVSSSASLGGLKYRLRYYAPLGSSPAGQAAQRHCDGSPITDGALLIRKEADGLAIPDWSNGTVTPLGTPFALDVNFDGVPHQVLADQPDWNSLDLRQIGARANFGSISVGSIATDAGSIATDAGSIATDAGSIATDAGSIATDAGSIATDAGSIATDAGSIATDAGDEDYDSHVLTTTDAIPGPQQCPGCGLKAESRIDSIKLTWTPPETGDRLVYNIYRCASVGCNPLQASAIFRTSFTPPDKAAPVFVDAVTDFVNAGASCPANRTCYNTPYTYSATAVSRGGAGTESPFSNVVNGKVTHLFVIADSHTIVYGSPIPPATFTIQGEVAGALTSGVSCAYDSAAVRNVGDYTITCTGPATISPVDGVDYQKPYLSFIPGKLTITPRPITVAAVAAEKTYDGTNASTAIPAITLGSLASGDTLGFTESFDSRNAGSRTLIPAGIVNDQNGGHNYTVTFVNGAGVINKRPITVTATPDTKTYDGTAASSAIPSTAGGLGAGDTAAFTQTFDSRNAGSRTLTPAGSVNDLNGGNNYAITFVNGAGVINKRPITVTATPDTKTYDGTAASSAIPSTAGGLGAGDTAAFTQTFDSRNAGSRTLTPAGSVNDQYGGNNYAITFVNGAGVINKRPITVTAAPDTKTYDGTTASSATPSVTGGLGAGDTATFTQSFDSRNAGSRTLIPAGSVNDLNGGDNYAVSLVNAAGVIYKAPLSIAAVSFNKTYDGNTAAGATPVVTGLRPGDSVSGVAEAYDSPNAGNRGLLVLATFTVTDGNSGNNYAVTLTPAAGVILRANATIVVTPYNVPQDGLPHTSTGTATGVLNESLGGLDLSQTTHTAAGDYLNDPWTFTDPAANYNSAAGTVHNVIVATNQIDFSSLTLPQGGNAQLLNNGSVLRLTGADEQRSAAWWVKRPVSAGFSTTFTFRITPVGSNQLADGFAFVIHNAPNGANTLGTGGLGGYLGYTGIPNSIAIEFDTYRNTEYGDPSAFLYHVGIQSNGAGANSSDHNANIAVHTPPAGANFADGAIHTATITYDGATLKLFLDGGSTAIASAPVNLASLLTLDNGSAYIGFTAATGAAQENSDILSWTWN